MQQRPVPRNIDRPNRTAEYLVTFLFFYYTMQFAFQKPTYSLITGFAAVYLVYRATLGKPEGVAFRLWYRRLNIGHFVPNPRTTRKFEL